MRSSSLLFAALTCLVAPSSSSPAERLKVVTTIPDLADIVREVGGDRVEVQSIAKGGEDLHGLRSRPSHLIALNRADVFVQMGLSLEHAWVPGLLMAARNQAINGDKAPGFIDVSQGWEAIDVPVVVSRRNAADAHPAGNPHFNLSIHGGHHITARVLEGLSRIDPEGAAEYERRAAAYVERLDAAVARWKELGKRLAGKTVVQYHETFDYLFGDLSVEVVGTIETKPGVPATPPHVLRLVKAMRERETRVIISEAWVRRRPVDDVAEKTDARVVILQATAGGLGGDDTWIGMMDRTLGALAEAYGVEASPPGVRR